MKKTIAKIAGLIRRVIYRGLNIEEQLARAIKNSCTFGERTLLSPLHEIYSVDDMNNLLSHANLMIEYIKSFRPSFSCLWELTTEDCNAYFEEKGKTCTFRTLFNYSRIIVRIMLCIGEYYGVIYAIENINNFKEESNREVKLLRRFDRLGYRFRKASYTHRKGENAGGYMIINKRTSKVIAGEGFTLTLNDVEKFIEKLEV